jgi:malate dehydrogenase (oxaloacetate-decarboxylating)
MITTPSPSYSITVRLEIENQIGMFGSIATVIGEKGGDIGAVDMVRAGKGLVVRDFTINARDETHEKEIVASIKAINGVRVIHVTDRTFLQHLGGKIEIHTKVPVKTRADLARVYTPGVSRVCSAIQKESEKAYRFTMKRNTVGIITDGSAVLGLGNIGPLAALPVMEGKAMLFKEFAHVDAFPLCLATTDTEEIIQTVKNVAPVFGGINLEDIAAPQCFEIEERLKAELDIPVFHDDQHGTAVVTLAALLNAASLVGKKLGELKVVIAGAGAAGTACCRILREVGVSRIIVCDSEGIIYKGREQNMNKWKAWLADNTNPDIIKGHLHDAIDRADVFIGVSVPDILTANDLQRMNADPIVFALANPSPEIAPEEAYPHVRILATGRSDYPNQINNMLCFPGLFRGLLDSRASAVTEEIKLAAAQAIASTIDQRDLSEDYIIPSIFDRKVVPAVAAAVADTAARTGFSGKEKLAN